MPQTASHTFGVGPEALRPSEGGLGRPASRFGRLDAPISFCDCAPGDIVYAEGDAAERIYEVVSGMVRTVRSTSEGRRIVDGFFVPGDVFGLSGERTYASTAEAVVDCRLEQCERACVERLALVDRTAAMTLWSWLTRGVEHTAAHAPLLARGDAQEKVVAFIFEMADRLGADRRVELRMSRDDIADYMGLSSETVSRIFAVLRAGGMIALEGRTVVMQGPMLRRRAGRATRSGPEL
jgi:CRP-like cAMP-binding protein